MQEDFLEGRKEYKTIARRMHESFRATYSWMPYNPQWKVTTFKNLLKKMVKEIKKI